MTSEAPTPSTPWLSLLVPVYRVEAYVEACLISVMSQWQPGVEVVVLDDASPDRSADIARGVAALYPGRIRVFTAERNGGLAAARNRLLRETQADFVWFLDSDDVLMPGALAELRAVIEADPVDLVMCDFAVVRKRSGLRHFLRGEGHRSTFRGPSPDGTDASSLVEGVLRGRQLHAWSKIARREIWASAPFPEGRYFEDIPVLPALAGAVQRWRHVGRPWVGYRQRAGSILSTVDARKIEHLLQGLLELHRGIQARPAMGTHAVLRLLQTFALRAIASSARRLRPGRHEDDEVLARIRELIPEILPFGLLGALRLVREDGGWLPAWTISRRLRAAGLLR